MNTDRIAGLDISQGSVTIAILSNFPGNIQEFHDVNKKNKEVFLTLKANTENFAKFLDLNLTGLVIEPTGYWYSAIWYEVAMQANIPIYWVGHLDLVRIRGQYGFTNKKDSIDALCLAALYFEPTFIDRHNRRRFLRNYQVDPIEGVRRALMELEQLDKLRTAQVNQLRQRLEREFPEAASRDLTISPKLSFSPFVGWLAGLHSYPRVINDYAKSVAPKLGIEISDYTRNHARAILEIEQRICETEVKLADTLDNEAFYPYRKVFTHFGFGLTMNALILILVYPFDKFLVNGKQWIVWEETRPGNWNKYNRSLARFQAFMGLSYSYEISGKSKMEKKFHGSTLGRAHLYAWALSRIAPYKNPNRRLKTDVGQQLGEKFDILRGYKADDQGRRHHTPGKDAIIRVLFTTTRLLFRKLYQEITNND